MPVLVKQMSCPPERLLPIQDLCTIAFLCLYKENPTRYEVVTTHLSYKNLKQLHRSQQQYMKYPENHQLLYLKHYVRRLNCP